MRDLCEGRLLLGVEYQGVVHYDFSVNILTIGGECAALDMIEELGIDVDSQDRADKMLIDFAYLSQQLEITGIPKQHLTAVFLLDNLSTDDYVLITNLIAQLRKKRLDAGDSPKPAA